MWSKSKAKREEICFKCKKHLKIDEEVWVKQEHKGRTVPEGVDPCYYLHYCLDCGEDKQAEEQAEKDKKKQQAREKQEEAISSKAYAYTSQVAKLWDELGNKELNVDEVKRVNKLHSNISKLLKDSEKIRSWLDNTMLEVTLEDLKDILTDLKEHLKEYASPQTQEQAKGKGKRTCYHVLPSLEQHRGIYRCAYCWDSSSESFLKRLKSKGLQQGKNTDKPTPNPQDQENRPSRRSNKPIKNNDDNNQEKTKLQQAIKDLTNKPNRTPEEEQALQDKKRKLAELTNPKQSQGNQGKSSLGTYALIVLIIGVIVGLSYLLVKSKSKSKH